MFQVGDKVRVVKYDYLYDKYKDVIGSIGIIVGKPGDDGSEFDHIVRFLEPVPECWIGKGVNACEYFNDYELELIGTTKPLEDYM